MLERNTVLYPDYRDDGFMNLNVTVSAERNIKRPGDCFSFGAGLFFSGGSGNPRTDGSYSSGTSKVKSFDNWLYRQFEYNTASRAGGELSFTWTWLKFSNLAPYLKISDRFISLLHAPEYLSGGYRNMAQVTLGCNF